MSLLKQAKSFWSTNAEICDACLDPEVATIYLAIGSAMCAIQQYPPFLKDLGDKQVCIHIDPRLESPLTVLSSESSYLITEPDNILFIPIKRHFAWDEEEDKSFIRELCEIAMMRSKRLVVQDYTGRDITGDYPIKVFGPALFPNVLFDVTYKEGDCFPNLIDAEIYRKKSGAFVQPKYQTLQSMEVYLPATVLGDIIQKRNNEMVYYALRYYQVLCGEEAPEWISEELVQDRIRNVAPIYGFKGGPLTLENLEMLLTHYLMDLSSLSASRISVAAAMVLLRQPDRNYEKLVRELRRTIVENKSPE